MYVHKAKPSLVRRSSRSTSALFLFERLFLRATGYIDFGQAAA